jgi:hypothetical protein
MNIYTNVSEQPAACIFRVRGWSGVEANIQGRTTGSEIRFEGISRECHILNIAVIGVTLLSSLYAESNREYLRTDYVIADKIPSINCITFISTADVITREF